MVGQGRLELPTSRLSGARSNQLSYWPWKIAAGTGGAGKSTRQGWSDLVELRRFELLTSCLQSRRSTN